MTCPAVDPATSRLVIIGDEWREPEALCSAGILPPLSPAPDGFIMRNFLGRDVGDSGIAYELHENGAKEPFRRFIQMTCSGPGCGRNVCGEAAFRPLTDPRMCVIYCDAGNGRGACTLSFTYKNRVGQTVRSSPFTVADKSTRMTPFVVFGGGFGARTAPRAGESKPSTDGAPVPATTAPSDVDDTIHPGDSDD